MFKDLSDNLNTLMLKARINSNELARSTGLPASTIRKIRNCDNPNPTLTTLLPIAKFFSITLSQLIGETEQPFQLESVPISEVIQTVPFLAWEDMLHWPDEKKYRSSLTVENKYSKDTYALMIDEDEWETFPKGTIFIIDPQASIEHKDLAVLFHREMQRFFLKNILLDENKIYLKSPIPGCQATVLTPEHKILGIVMEYRKETKKTERPISLQRIEKAVILSGEKDV